MMPIQKSEDTDDYYIRQYRNVIEGLCGVDIEKKKTLKPCWAWWLPNKLRDSGWSWILAETGMTAVLIILTASVLFIKT